MWLGTSTAWVELDPGPWLLAPLTLLTPLVLLGLLRLRVALRLVEAVVVQWAERGLSTLSKRSAVLMVRRESSRAASQGGTTPLA
jgi:hypothetical protein